MKEIDWSGFQEEPGRRAMEKDGQPWLEVIQFSCMIFLGECLLFSPLLAVVSSAQQVGLFLLLVGIPVFGGACLVLLLLLIAVPVRMLLVLASRPKSVACGEIWDQEIDGLREGKTRGKLPVA